jgi:aspartate/methionine/tyrosine aminotransferase
MSQNTNHIPTDPRIAQAMTDAIARGEHNFYPYAKGIEGLAGAILADLQLSSGWDVGLVHGGLEGGYVTTRALLQAGDNVVASDPSFLPLHGQIALCGATTKELPIYGPPWKLTPEAVNEAVDAKTKMILLIDPLNPLGSGYTRSEVKALAEIANDRNLVLIHDITYRDFSYEAALAGTWAPENTIYVYSFSKNCGFAGLRLGALVAQKPLLDRIRPFFVSTLGVNVLAQEAAKVALSTKKDWIGRVVQTSRDNQKIVRDTVAKVEGLTIPVYPSSSNTLVIDVAMRKLDPNALEDELLYNHRVFIRGGPYLSKRFGNRFVRVSVTVPTAGAKRFADAFPRAVEAVESRRR